MHPTPLLEDDPFCFCSDIFIILSHSHSLPDSILAVPMNNTNKSCMFGIVVQLIVSPFGCYQPQTYELKAQRKSEGERQALFYSTAKASTAAEAGQHR